MTATWSDVARKDVADAVRSRMLWGIVGIFVTLMGLLLVIAPVTLPIEGEITAERALAFVTEVAQLFVPVVALIVSYMAIVGERRNGSLRILMTYPFSRSDFVVGKLVGRATVIGIALMVGIVTTTLLAIGIYGLPGGYALLGLAISVLLFGLAFTGIGVGVSAATHTRGRAMAIVLSIYLVFLMFWDGLVAAAYFAINGTMPGLRAAGWYFFLLRLNPIEAFRALVDRALEPTVPTAFVIPVEDIPSDVSGEQLELANRVSGELPFYLGDWTLILILLFWTVFPLIIGYYRFAKSDIAVH